MAQYFCRAVDTIVDHTSLERSAGKTSPAAGNYLSADVQQLRFRAAVGQSVSDLAQRLRRAAVFVGTAVDHHDLHEKNNLLEVKKGKPQTLLCGFPLMIGARRSSIR